MEQFVTRILVLCFLQVLSPVSDIQSDQSDVPHQQQQDLVMVNSLSCFGGNLGIWERVEIAFIQLIIVSVKFPSHKKHITSFIITRLTHLRCQIQMKGLAQFLQFSEVLLSEPLMPFWTSISRPETHIYI